MGNPVVLLSCHSSNIQMARPVALTNPPVVGTSWHVEFRAQKHISHSGLQKQHTAMALVQLRETIWMCLKILKIWRLYALNIAISIFFSRENSDIPCDFWGTLFSDKPKSIMHLEWPLGSCCSVFMLVFSANHESGSVRGVQRAWGTAHQWRDHRDCAEGVSRWVGMPCAFLCCTEHGSLIRPLGEVGKTGFLKALSSVEKKTATLLFWLCVFLFLR